MPQEHELSEIYGRLRETDIRDAKQDTDIELLKQIWKSDIGYIKDALSKLTNGKSEACLEHTAEIEALKLAQKNLEASLKEKASKRDTNALWAIVTPVALLMAGAIVKYLFFA